MHSMTYLLPAIVCMLLIISHKAQINCYQIIHVFRDGIVKFAMLLTIDNVLQRNLY
jgi:hypothetical protein